MGVGRVEASEMKSAVWGFGVLRSSGYFVLFHAFIGRKFNEDMAWIEIKSLFFRLVFLVRTVDLEVFQAQLTGFSLPYLFIL